MRNIKNILAGTFALATVALVAGCIKDDYIGTCEQPKAGDITIVASLDKMKLTKATVEDNATERTITHIDIFVIDSEGNIDWYERNADGNDKTQGQGNGYLKLSQKRTTKVNGNYLFEQGENYRIYLLANSTQTEATMKSLLTKDALEALVEQTEKVYYTGMEDEAPQTFLMDAVAKLGNSASIEINPVTTPTEHLELKATFNRAASKVIVNIKQGTEVSFVPEGINSVLPQAEFNNLATKTSVLPLASPLADAGLTNSDARNVDDKVLAWDADSKTYTVTAYTYSHLWEEGADNESALIVNIPMLWDEDGKDEAGNLEIKDQAPESWYKIPLSQDNEFRRNFCYIVNLTINAVGAPSELDIIELQDVEFVSLPWQEVEMEIGQNEPKYLVLNTDLVEIYDVNEDLEQLKFTSSSPIKSITLKDCYNHDDFNSAFESNVEMEDAQKDGVYAYYIDKFGKKVQLGTDPGFDIKVVEQADWTKEQILAKELNLWDAKQIDANGNPILDEDGNPKSKPANEQYIRAQVWEEHIKALNGNISIYSPILPVKDNEDLNWPSHFNTVRYLEFEVMNEQGLTATFRVEQIPLTVISNKQGFFSYRSDFCINDSPQHYNVEAFTTHFPSNAGVTKPFDKYGPHHYLNPREPFWSVAGFIPYHTHECDEDGTILDACGVVEKNNPTNDEMVYGLMSRDYYRAFDIAASVFHRDHYVNKAGNPVPGEAIISNGAGKYYQAIGICFQDPNTGKYQRRHYVGQFQSTFYSKYVSKVYQSDGANANGIPRKRGEADINTQMPVTSDTKPWGPWTSWGVQRALANHRMYHVRVTSTSNEFTVALPLMMDENGNLTEDRTNGYTMEGKNNSIMVSPSFMVASQLGSTNLPVNDGGYERPGVAGFYIFSRHQCREYVETRYEDKNGNGKYDAGEPVYHYDDWRLPTKAEVEYIIKYQSASRAMDKVMNAQYYFVASTNPDVYDESTVYSPMIPDYDSAYGGHFMRCVRDAYIEPEPVIYDSNYNIISGKPVESH